MTRFFFLATVLATCAACSRPTLKQSFEQCVAKGQRTVGAAQDADPYIADCMSDRGYRIRRECLTLEAPARLERCYHRKGD